MGCGFAGGGIREACPKETIWEFTPFVFVDLPKHVWMMVRRLGVSWEVWLLLAPVALELLRQTLGDVFLRNVAELDEGFSELGSRFLLSLKRFLELILANQTRFRQQIAKSYTHVDDSSTPTDAATAFLRTAKAAPRRPESLPRNLIR